MYWQYFFFDSTITTVAEMGTGRKEWTLSESYRGGHGINFASVPNPQRSCCFYDKNQSSFGFLFVRLFLFIYLFIFFLERV